MVRLVAVLVIAMKAWMLVDAYRRRAETYWLWIIVGVPGGSLLYFFMVKLRDPGMQRIQRRVMGSLRRPPDPKVLQRRYEESPSIANRLTLAQALGDAGRFKEASSHFAAVLEQRPGEFDALYGLGVCELEMGRFGEAIAPLQEVVGKAPLYRDFAAYPELAEALFREQRTEECLALLRSLAKSHPRLSHVVLLARYLKRAGKAGEAATQLKRALEQHEDAPRYVKRDNRAWERAAKRMLSELQA